MKKPSVFKAVFGSFIVSVIITLIVMTISFLLMIFSSGEDGYRATLFNTIYFKSTTAADGVVDISFGLTGNYTPLIVIAALIFVFLFCTWFIYEKLKIYKENLLIERGIK